MSGSAALDLKDMRREPLEAVVVRFAGDSGDGIQLTGGLFTEETAIAGNDFRACGIQGHAYATCGAYHQKHRGCKRASERLYDHQWGNFRPFPIPTIGREAAYLRQFRHRPHHYGEFLIVIN